MKTIPKLDSFATTYRHQAFSSGAIDRGIAKALQVWTLMPPRPDISLEQFNIDKEAVTNGKRDE